MTNLKVRSLKGLQDALESFLGDVCHMRVVGVGGDVFYMHVVGVGAI